MPLISGEYENYSLNVTAKSFRLRNLRCVHHPGRVLFTSPRFKIFRILSWWNSSQGTTEVTCLVLTANKTCCSLPFKNRESWMTVTAKRCWWNFVVDLSVLNSNTLLRKFHDCNLNNIAARLGISHPITWFFSDDDVIYKIRTLRSVLELLMWSFVYSHKVFNCSASHAERWNVFERQNSVQSSLEF